MKYTMLFIDLEDSSKGGLQELFYWNFSDVKLDERVSAMVIEQSF